MPPFEPDPPKAETPKVTELSIMTKTFDMAQYAYQALSQFPKGEKLSLVSEIKRCITTLIRLEVTAQKKYYKKTTLQDLDVELSVLRYYVRLSMLLGFLPLKKYDVWTEKLTEIGKMLGGWIKSNAAAEKEKSSKS
jgi:four helix bundle protein